MPTMKTKCAKALAVLTAGLLGLSAAGHAAAKDKGSRPKQEPTTKQESTPKKKQFSPAKTRDIGLQSKLASMRLHDGPNLVYSGDGVKLMAEARNNKIVGWSATDDKGNKLSTTVQKDSAGKVKGIGVLKKVDSTSETIVQNLK
jgi:hypothetical protein